MRRAHRSRAAAPVAVQAAPLANIHRALLLLMVLAAAAVYANSLSNPFVMDDKRAVVDNPRIRILWPLTIPLDAPDETPVARRPLVNLTFAVNYAIGGLDVRGYHVGNLLIHLASGLVLFGLVRRTLALGDLPERFGLHANALAVACTAIWLLHPIHTEIVNYVSQRTSALLGLCYLLTLYCSTRALRGGRRWAAAAVLACAAGMASKESMVTGPVLVVLFDRAFVFESFAEAYRRRRGLYLGLASTWLLLWALMVSGDRTSVGFETGISAWTYLLNQAPVLVNYLRLVIWPVELVADYGPARPVLLRDVIWQGMLIVALAGGALVAVTRWRHAGWLCLSIFVLLAPTSTVVPISTEVGAERRMYLPLAALVVLVVCLLYRAGTAMRSRAKSGGSGARALVYRYVPIVGMAMVVIVCAGYALAIVNRNREYESMLTLARTTVERRPHGRALFTLGHELVLAGRRDEAMGFIRTAAKTFPWARFALGSELLADGDLARGIDELRAFTEVATDKASAADARHMIATALAVQGREHEALDELRGVLATAPRHRRALASVGETLLRMKRSREALNHLEKAVRVYPRDPHLHNLLGNALAMDGRLADARAQFQLSVSLDPDYKPAYTNLARAEQLLAQP